MEEEEGGAQPFLAQVPEMGVLCKQEGGVKETPLPLVWEARKKKGEKSKRIAHPEIFMEVSTQSGEEC